MQEALALVGRALGALSMAIALIQVVITPNLNQQRLNGNDWMYGHFGGCLEDRVVIANAWSDL